MSRNTSPPGAPSLVASPLIVVSLLLASCGGSGSSNADTAPAETIAAETTPAEADPQETSAAAPAGFLLVEPEEAAAIIADPPDDLVILDVRTQEEFDEGHIEGAVMLDFYRDDFETELADLDPNVPYVVYCRSGNRSGQTIALMEDLEFRTVADVDGGVLAWETAGLPLTTG